MSKALSLSMIFVIGALLRFAPDGGAAPASARRIASARQANALPAKAPDWEITFSQTWGRRHESGSRFTITSAGELKYDVNGAPVIKKISAEAKAEIAALLKRLNLPMAKTAPQSFDACILSPHLPIVSFTLNQASKDYTLIHCNGVKPKYEFTLNLSQTQKQAYQRLRQKAQALYGEALKKTD